MSDKEYFVSSEVIRERVKNATPEKIREYIKEYGRLSVRLAFFHNAVIEKLKLPKIQGYPPGIFISYRWENDEHKKWVLSLANYLKGIGYKVFLDQYDVDLNPESFHEIPNFISSIASCHYFLIVISPGYLDRVLARKGQTSWVFDEYQQALHLVKSGKLKLRAVVVEGNEWLNVCDSFNTVNLSSYNEDFSRIHQIFPTYQKVVLSDDENNKLIEFLQKIDDLQKLNSFKSALELIHSNRKFLNYFEVRLRQMKSLFYLGEFDKSASIAIEIINEPELEFQTIIEIVEILYRCKKYEPALKKLVLLRKALKHRDTFNVRSDNLNMRVNYFDTYPSLVDESFILMCHFLIGNILEDLGSYIGAVNHFKYSLSKINNENHVDQSTLLNNIGFAYKNGRMYEEAIYFFNKSIEKNPNHVLPYENLAISLREIGKKSEALSIASALDKFPDYGAKFLNLVRFIQADEPLNHIPEKNDLLNITTYSCSSCNAEYSIDSEVHKICGDCGSIELKQNKYCKFCSNDGSIPLFMLKIPALANVLCPICLKGEINTTPNK